MSKVTGFIEFKIIFIRKLIYIFFCVNTDHVQSQPRERNQKGETPLHTASIKNEMDNVRKLLEAGENPNVTDFAGKLMLIVFGVEE